MLKTYEYRQGDTALVTLKVGLDLKSIKFTGGTKKPTKKLPTFRTGEKALQEAIERCIQYKKKKIVLKSTENSQHYVAPDGEVKYKDTTKEIKEIPDITTVQEAKEYLLDKYNLKISDLPNKSAVLDKAFEKSISFSDLT